MKETIEQIAVFDSEFRQLFEKSEIVELTVNEEAKVFSHPLENGASIVDHKVTLPVEVELTMLLEADAYRDTYQDIREFFNSNKTAIVQTRTDAYASMVLAGMPHEERADMMDVIPVRLKFVQATFVETQYQALPPKKVKDKRSASTVKRGEQQPKKKQSVLASIDDKIGIVGKTQNADTN